MGWTLPDVWSMPMSYYRTLVAMLNEQARAHEDAES